MRSPFSSFPRFFVYRSAAGLRRAGAAILILALAGCISFPMGYLPRQVAGLPTDENWTALPLRSWLGEDRGEPEAIVACMTPNCPHLLAVGVFRLTGRGARDAQAVLRDPTALARYITAQDAREQKEKGTSAARKRIRTSVATRPLAPVRGASGFLITLSGNGDPARTAYGAALGVASGDTLRLVLAIGDDEAGVEAAARQVAAEML